MTLLILLVVGIAVGKTQGFEWFVLKNAIRAQYPAVRRITSAQLADWLADPERGKPILLDVRSEAELDVSHLPLARRVEPGAPIQSIALPHDTAIVTYCSVGYRSSELAKRLVAGGFTDVQNLEGSIFEWANEHRPLVRGSEKVTQVHPHTSWWGELLSQDVRAQVAR